MQAEQCQSNGAHRYSPARAKFAFWESLRISGISAAIALVAGPTLYFVPRYWPDLGLLPVTPEAVAVGFVEILALYHPFHFIAAYVKNRRLL